jgi:hypothetical protein
MDPVAVGWDRFASELHDGFKLGVAALLARRRPPRMVAESSTRAIA